MERSVSTIAFFLLAATLMGQQPVGTWSDHLRYNTSSAIAVSDQKIFASTGNSLLVFDKQYNELKKLSKVNGLSETGISTVAWSDEYNILIVAYKSSAVDLVFTNSVYNINDIKNAATGEKTINRIRTADRYAYLASELGIIVVDLVKKEIRDTWKPSPGTMRNTVYDIAFGDNKVFAATDLGVWYAGISDQGLAYFGNWKQIESVPSTKCSLAVFSNGKLFVNIEGPLQDGDYIYSVSNETALFSHMNGVHNRSIENTAGGFIVTSSGSARFYNSRGSLEKTIESYGWGEPDICQTIADGNDIWLADKKYGLVREDKTGSFTSLTLNSPYSDNSSSISSLNGKTIICAGGADNRWNRLGIEFRFSVFDNNKFTGILSGQHTDAMRSCIDPSDNRHYYISSWGDGLFEYRDDNLVNHFEASNSPLGNDIDGTGGIRIGGLAFDKSGNLWLSRSGTPGRIFIHKKDGGWIDYPVHVDSPVLGDIISTSEGQMWILLPGGGGVFVLDYNGTPDLFTDDRYKRIQLTDSEGNYFSPYSFTEDLDGNVWVGTDKGPVVYFNTGNITGTSPVAYRIKIPRNDGSGFADYLLGSENITSIAVDGANRKWLGTAGSGVYLVSAAGNEVLKSLNSKNSPLFSDSLSAVAVDNKSGEVWFGTSSGILSVRDLATSGENGFSNVYSFPNPVREDFEGNVTITGLMRDSQVKITDVGGNLVYETFSVGGQASWDLNTFNGRRVVTGVYLVFCSSADGSQSCVTKILVVSR